MKRYIKSSSESSHLEGLVEDVLSDVYDDDPSMTIRDVISEVIDLVILIITKMDTDGVYSEYYDKAKKQDKSFLASIRRYVKSKYDNYDWYLE